MRNGSWADSSYPLLAWLISLYPREDAVPAEGYTATAFYCYECAGWITGDWVAHVRSHLFPPATSVA